MNIEASQPRGQWKENVPGRPATLYDSNVRFPTTVAAEVKRMESAKKMQDQCNIVTSGEEKTTEVAIYLIRSGLYSTCEVEQPLHRTYRL